MLNHTDSINLLDANGEPTGDATPVGVDVDGDSVRVVVGIDRGLDRKNDPSVTIERADGRMRVFINPDNGDEAMTIEVLDAGNGNDRRVVAYTCGGKCVLDTESTSIYARR